MESMNGDKTSGTTTTRRLKVGEMNVKVGGTDDDSPPNTSQPTPPTPNLRINQDMLNYMLKISQSKIITDERKNEIFDPAKLEFMNKSVRNCNYYMLDKFGLVIRKNFQDSKKTAFGWRYDTDNQPINIHINDILLQTNSSQIRDITLQQLKNQFPSLFKPPRGTIYRVYSVVFPEIDLDKL